MSHSTPPQTLRTRHAGFTLTEMLVTISVLAILTGPLVVVFRQTQGSFLAQTDQAELLQKMRIAMAQMTRTIRQAGNEPVADIGPAVEVLGAGHLRLRTDITGSSGGSALSATGDPDGAASALFEVVTFRYDANQRRIMADFGLGESVLVERISDLSFVTTDLNGNPSLDPDEIASVQVVMVGETAGSDMQMGERYAFTLSSEAFLRSRTPQVLP
ncbi:MAG: hypothetical protein Kow001_15500 [Acidobacteriota bacterium]